MWSRRVQRARREKVCAPFQGARKIATFVAGVDVPSQLDPTGQKSMIDIQNEAALEQERATLHFDGNHKGKRLSRWRTQDASEEITPMLQAV